MKRLLPHVLLGVLSVALLATGVIFLGQAHSRSASADSANLAVVDTSATNRVISEVSTGLAQVLSYDYTKPQVAQQAAAKWLSGDAPGQYKLLFQQLTTLAKGQNLTLVARVVSAGVTSLKGDTAQLLVFVDQQSTRASDKQSSVSAAQLQIAAARKSGHWTITELKPL